ncbi:putative endopeptidase [Pedococcus dokdonensis]|uniref:Putative endopeptidase n=1 Tax=Pedococcus dokdonensis TaxID=443156 RepID=A0A1H0LYV5_9MICO|nr:M13-type metalloendopeptidase [Pedococcus dokdonensis]SDO73273.1 putative endopeptidase [Pedococcus dokdonensis]
MRSGILPGHRDDAVRPQDDLFGHANGTWVRDTEIPSDRGRYGTFDLLREQSDERVRTIVERAAADTEAPAGSPTRKVGDLYRAFMDEERVEELGLAPIADDLAAVAQVSDLDGLFTTLGRLQREGGPGLFEFGVAPDAKNPEEYVLYLGQAGLGLPDESYYREERHAAILTAYLPFVGRMLGFAGIGDGSTDEGSPAARVVALETRLAGHHWDNVATRDAVKSYNPFGYAALAGLAPGVGWDAFVDSLDARDAFAQVVVGQPSYLEGLSALLQDTPLDDLKHWLAFHVVRSAAPLLSRELVDAEFDFTGRVISGLPENRERWKRGVSLVESSIGEAVGQLYAAEYFPPEAKQRMLDLVANLVEAFRRSFEGLDWMGPQTREQALAKLSSFTPKVGYPDRWRDYSALTIDDDLVGNVRRANEFELRRQLAKLGGPIDRDEWLMLPQTVNAYYHPLMNEIVFPAGILQPPFFDLEADDAVNYGGIGAVIGHEIGHGFDDQGSRYDATGALRDWWTEEDRARFDERTQALITQFNALSPLAAPDEKVNGALTVGENIGDLGGLAIGYSAYRIATEGKEVPELDGYTGQQRFFLGWAQVWSGKARTEEAKRLLAIDPHSPTEVRANAVRNCDEFHEAFAVSEGDGMWLAPEERVHIF